MSAYPVLEFDYKKYPELADNIWNAQMAGHPRVLTYCGPLLKKANRKGAMRYSVDASEYDIPIILKLSRDEYHSHAPLRAEESHGLATYLQTRTVPRVVSLRLSFVRMVLFLFPARDRNSR
jgi:hypothetical protein